VSFRPDEIAAEFAEATGGGREWFDGDGYGFRRLPKLRNDDLEQLAGRLRMKRHYWASAEYRAAALARGLAKVRRRQAARALPVECPGCGQVFVRKRWDQKTCSALCNQRAWRRRQRAQGRRPT
jgi:hypothetical protein